MSDATVSVRVGPDAGDVIDVPGKPPKQPFKFTEAVDGAGQPVELDSRGLLLGVPYNWSNDFKPLKRGDFALRVTYLEFRLLQQDRRIEKQQKARAEIVDEIAACRELGDPVKLKKRRVQKMAEQFQAMLDSLQKDGLSAADLGITLNIDDVPQ